MSALGQKRTSANDQGNVMASKRQHNDSNNSQECCTWSVNSPRNIRPNFRFVNLGAPSILSISPYTIHKASGLAVRKGETLVQLDDVTDLRRAPIVRTESRWGNLCD